MKEVDCVLRLVRHEAGEAIEVHGPDYSSAHEAFAVLLEEVEEFKEQVWFKRAHGSKQKMVNELVQVAAVSVKYAAQLQREMQWEMGPEKEVM